MHIRTHHRRVAYERKNASCINNHFLDQFVDVYGLLANRTIEILAFYLCMYVQNEKHNIIVYHVDCGINIQP